MNEEQKQLLVLISRLNECLYAAKDAMSEVDDYYYKNVERLLPQPGRSNMWDELFKAADTAQDLVCTIHDIGA